MGNLRALMMDKDFNGLSLADQTDLMRQAGAPDELLSEWVARNATGPMISASDTPTPEGFEDTSADVERIQETYHEPNRARDVLPKLLEFSTLAATAGLPGAVGRGVAGLRGLSRAQKAATVAKNIKSNIALKYVFKTPSVRAAASLILNFILMGFILNKL